MYAQYWGLTETPFKNTLDTRWFYESPVHEEALARLFFLVEERRRCGVLFGPQGTGKSLLIHVLSRQVRRTQRDVVVIDLIGRSGQELLWETAAALGLAPHSDASTWNLWRSLQDHLQVNQHAEFPTVLIFDHFDRAGADCTGIIQRLFHLNPGSASAITLILSIRTVNLPRLAGTLGELSDLRIELPSFDLQQTQQYVEWLLATAGAKSAIFTDAALEQLQDYTQGIPRDLNRLCDLSLLAAMADGEHQVDAPVVMAAAEELHQLTQPGRDPLAWPSRLGHRTRGFGSGQPIL